MADGTSKATVAARVQAREREKLADIARDKLARGEQPTQNELRAWNRVEKDYTEHYGQRFVSSITKTQYIAWSGKESPTVYAHADKYGVPLRGKSVSIPDVIRWMHSYLAGSTRTYTGLDEELEPGVNDGSPQLERLRAAKADLAEYERDKKLGELAPISEFKSFLVVWSQRLRQAGEVMAKPTCADPHAVFLDALEDCERMILEKYPDVQGDITG